MRGALRRHEQRIRMALTNLSSPTPRGRALLNSYKGALAVMTTLFFMWGS